MPLPLPRQTEPAPEGLRLGSYVTDGTHLLRVVAGFEAGPGGMFASLEDCLTLEVRPYSPAELIAMGLRQVASEA